MGSNPLSGATQVRQIAKDHTIWMMKWLTYKNWYLHIKLFSRIEKTALPAHMLQAAG
jgi:hypothetical protein